MAKKSTGKVNRKAKEQSRALALTGEDHVSTSVICPHPKVCKNGTACVKKFLEEGRASETHTVTSRKSNGAMPESHAVPIDEPEHIPVGEAMRLAVEALGDVVIDNDLAPEQLRQLAACYEDVTRRQAAFNAKNDEAKTAKKSLESATNLLLEKVRTFTHPVALPLFDQTARESDHADMLAGAQDVETTSGEDAVTSRISRQICGCASFQEGARDL